MRNKPLLLTLTPMAYVVLGSFGIYYVECILGKICSLSLISAGVLVRTLKLKCLNCRYFGGKDD